MDLWNAVDQFRMRAFRCGILPVRRRVAPSGKVSLIALHSVADRAAECHERLKEASSNSALLPNTIYRYRDG